MSCDFSEEMPHLTIRELVESERPVVPLEALYAKYAINAEDVESIDVMYAPDLGVYYARSIVMRVS